MFVIICQRNETLSLNRTRSKHVVSFFYFPSDVQKICIFTSHCAALVFTSYGLVSKLHSNEMY